MEEIMQSNTFFIVPLTIAYASICGLWFVFNRKTKWWPIESIPHSAKPKKDFILSLLAVVMILIIGQVYSAGYLIPNTNHSYTNGIIWVLNNLIIYAPIFIVIKMRSQGLATVLLSPRQIHIKLLFGLGASMIGVGLFLLLRGELGKFPEVISKAIQFKSLTYFPAVFLENVAIAFLFVRLKWLIGIKWAIIIPAILFAFAHVPGSVAEGDSLQHILIFFFLTGSLTTIILYTAYRARDIVWLGLVHYQMDIVIKAF